MMLTDKFASYVLSDWDLAMDKFFSAVERKRVERGLSAAAVKEALARGYGSDIADAWDEWMD